MTYSIDLSHLNANFDWSKLSPDVSLVIIKISEGMTFKDPKASYYLQQIKDKDLSYGLYWFLHPTSPGAAQANNFCDTAEELGIDWHDPKLILIACDVENTNDDNWVQSHQTEAIQAVQDSLNTVQSRTGLKPFIYTYPGFWKPTLGNPTNFAAYRLWEANYSNNPMVPFGGWQNLTLHQFSQNGSHVNSNDGGDVDWSRTTYTLEQLKAFGI